MIEEVTTLPVATLPAIIAVACSFIIPKLVTWMTAKIPSRTATFAIAVVFSAVVGAIAAYVSGANLADIPAFAAATVAMANLVYSAYKAATKPNKPAPKG